MPGWVSSGQQRKLPHEGCGMSSRRGRALDQMCRVENWMRRMKRLFRVACLAVLWTVGRTQGLAAQDLVITNVRILVGNGTVVNQGSIVIRGGRLASVAAGVANV